MTDREAIIRERAYRLWEAEGRPDGRHEHHWSAAEQEIGADPRVSSAGGEAEASGLVSAMAGTPDPMQPDRPDRSDTGASDRAVSDRMESGKTSEPARRARAAGARG